MEPRFTLISRPTANLLEFFDTREAALAFVQQGLAEYGRSWTDELILAEFDEEGAPIPFVAGAELAALATGEAQYAS